MFECDPLQQAKSSDCYSFLRSFSFSPSFCSLCSLCRLQSLIGRTVFACLYRGYRVHETFERTRKSASRFGERSWAVNNLNLVLTDCVRQWKTFSLSSCSLIFRLRSPNALFRARADATVERSPIRKKCGNNKRYKHLSHEHPSNAILFRSLFPFAVLILFISFPDSRLSMPSLLLLRLFFLLFAI